jgi:hypothetical protein
MIVSRVEKALNVLLELCENLFTRRRAFSELRQELVGGLFEPFFLALQIVKLLNHFLIGFHQKRVVLLILNNFQVLTASHRFPRK